MKNYKLIIAVLVTTIFTGLCSAKDEFKPKPASASVYQYAVSFDTRKAYLWIPENCRYVRGLIISMENSLERNWLEDPIVREAASKESLGIIWLADGKQTNISWEMKPDAIASLDKMFKDLAVESGYSEIANAPLIVMGHSWNGRIAWTYPNANPDRVIAAIPIRTYPMPETLAFSGIPLCYVVGQTSELPQYSDGRPGDRDFYWPVVRESAITLRTNNEENLIGVATDPGGVHTDWSDHQGRFVSLFIRKACQYRLPNAKPADGKVNLKPISKESGWLTDTGGMDPDKFAPAPYKSYKGDPKKAYWFFDEEMARAAVAFNGDRKTREKQMPTFVQDGKILPVDKSGYVQLKFQPDNDGLTFHLKGGFLSEVPDGLIGAGTKLNYGPELFSFRVTHGIAFQTEKNTFQVQFDRQAFRPPMIQVIQQGNDQYRRSTQPGKVNLPARNSEGKPQTISFPEIGNQKVGVKSLQMKAISDAGIPVSYYVTVGPAVVEGNQLIFTEIPPRSKYPVTVTVVAWQYGRSIEPKVKTAEPIVQTFIINK